MKLTIGENIRNFRKKNDLTQEALADRLGVTYQSVSRWENGTTYPDLELLPAISEVLGVTVDELIGMHQVIKEKQAAEVVDELRRECMKRDYDADRIVALLRDIRINYINSDSAAWRPWTENRNSKALRDPKVLPEVRLFAEAYLERNPLYPPTLHTMAVIEDEEHIADFLKKHTTAFDCSARALLFNRYGQRGEIEKFEAERCYQLWTAFSMVLTPRFLVRRGESPEFQDTADEFMGEMLSLIRRDAVGEGLDIWVGDRIELGIKSAARLVSFEKHDDAILTIEAAVKLLEESMQIKEEIVLPTSCRFLEDMKWTAKEDWFDKYLDPDRREERVLYISNCMSGTETCYCLHPSNIYDLLWGTAFDPIRSDPAFTALCDRVKALIVTRPKEK